MTFAIDSAAYDDYMGRYSSQLGPLFAEFCGVAAGMRVLDVGCGPGALTGELVRRVGAAHVAAIDPSPSFVAACRARLPGIDVQHGPAERLPWADAAFDAGLAQLVLSFVSDAEQVARELSRVVRPGGVIAACMWLEGPSLQISDLFWQAVAADEPAWRNTESKMPFRKPGEIAQLWRGVGLHAVTETTLQVRVTYTDFEDLWRSLEHSAGPVGAYMAKADEARRLAIHDAYRALLGRPTGSFELIARAGAARGTR